MSKPSDWIAARNAEVKAEHEAREPDLTARNGEMKLVLLTEGDDFTSNEALEIRLPDGRKILVWSDGSIEAVRTDGETIFIADETNWH